MWPIFAPLMKCSSQYSRKGAGFSAAGTFEVVAAEPAAGEAAGGASPGAFGEQPRQAEKARASEIARVALVARPPVLGKAQSLTLVGKHQCHPIN